MPMHDIYCNHPRPLYTRRHYEELAKYFREIRPQFLEANRGPILEKWRYAVNSMVQYFLEDNHLFQPGAFRAACNWNGDNPNGEYRTERERHHYAG